MTPAVPAGCRQRHDATPEGVLGYRASIGPRRARPSDQLPESALPPVALASPPVVVVGRARGLAQVLCGQQLSIDPARLSRPLPRPRPFAQRDGVRGRPSRSPEGAHPMPRKYPSLGVGYVMFSSRIHCGFARRETVDASNEYHCPPRELSTFSHASMAQVST